MNTKDNSLFRYMVNSVLVDCGISDWEVFHFESVDSTNDVARTLLENYDNVVVLADIQTKGRGTKGRLWESPLGGVWISLATRGNYPVMDYSSLTADHLTKLLSDILDEDCVHKPINDVMVRGKKLAGVLVETKIRGGTVQELVIGVGINVINDIPDYLKDTAISMVQIGLTETVAEIAKEVALELIFLVRSQIPDRVEDSSSNWR